MNTNPIDWTRLLLQAVFVVGPLLLFGYAGYRRLWWTLNEYRPHLHDEEEGTLHVSGIRYPRTLNGRH